LLTKRAGERLRDEIHPGAIVLAFRRWKRSQVVPPAAGLAVSAGRRG
jgi:hypothetical protein